MKLITHNIYCITSWESKKDILLKNYKELNPDILCIQELMAGKLNPSEEVNDISKELDARCVFVDPYKQMPNQGIFVKNGKVQIKEEFVFNLSGVHKDGSLDKHGRFVTATKLEIEDKELILINLHLSVIKQFRYQNWKEIKMWLESSGLIKQNVIIVGDMNCYEQEDVHTEILRDGFKDAWKEVNDEKCITYYSSRWWYENYPDHDIAKKFINKGKVWNEGCLDYIFYKGNIKIKSVKMLNLVPKVTDHVGLILDFDI